MHLVQTPSSAIERIMRHAFQRGEFELHYQPQVCIATGEVIGIEALIRWRHPELGVLLPPQFIPAAETCGLLVPMAEWVVRTACWQNMIWQEGGLPFLKMSVNLLPIQLEQQTLAATMRRILDETGLDPRNLDVELSAATVIGATPMLAQLRALRGIGISISIDNCGIGGSEAWNFTGHPLHQVKIDRSVIASLPFGANAASITRTIVSMGRSSR